MSMRSILDLGSMTLGVTSDSFSRICMMREGVGVGDGGRGSRHALPSRDVVEILRVARPALLDNSAVTERSTFGSDSPCEGQRATIVMESASTCGATTP